jgi:kynurenine formamidase
MYGWGLREEEVQVVGSSNLLRRVRTPAAAFVGVAVAGALLLGGTASSGPQPAAPQPAAPGQAPFGFDEVVFLSHVNTRSMPIYPGDPAVKLRTLFTVEEDGFRLKSMRIGEHSGTHWGSPCHFNAGEACAEDMEPEDFFRPAVVIDAREQSKNDVDYRLKIADIENFEAANGTIPDNAMVIMWTGFAGRWDHPKRYINADDEGVLHSPGFGAAVTKWLIKNRAVGGLGIDTLGVDPGNDEEFKTNTLLLKEHRIHLENLRGLGQMPPTGGWVVVGGVRNRGGSGSPATVFGLIP